MVNLKIFNKWDVSQVKLQDLGLINYITVTPMLVPKTTGRHEEKQFYKSRVNIVERLINKLFVSGHRGKKHKLNSGFNVGKTITSANIVKKAFEIIEKRMNVNPVQVLVTAVENSAPMEEVISYQKGGIFVREAVVTSPQRRVDLALKHLAQGTYKASKNSKKKAFEVLSEQLMLAYKNDATCMAISEKTRREKEARGAR